MEDGPARRASDPWLRRGGLLTIGGMLAAFATLQVALLGDRFEVQYVVEHHRRATGTFFTVTSAWAGLEGSLLLWATVIAAYVGLVAVRVTRRRSTVGEPAADAADRLGAGALVVMGVVAAFFTSLVLFVTPTFAAAPRAVGDGSGANPLLEDHVLMAIHPPLLYLGYVGFLVPFAFAMSALALRERGPRWVLRTQAWALVAWVFLTAGIVIGGWWSYDVLGWGGYWAWDPVENASFLPWLVGTAYLHSAVMQARRGMLPAWSVAPRHVDVHPHPARHVPGPLRGDRLRPRVLRVRRSDPCCWCSCSSRSPSPCTCSSPACATSSPVPRCSRWSAAKACSC